MCNAEATIVTYSWGGPHGIQADRSGLRKCTNWDVFDEWAQQRALQVEDKETFLTKLVLDS